MNELIERLRNDTSGRFGEQGADAIEHLTAERDALAETMREIEAKTHKHPYGIAQEVNALCTRHAFTAILAARDARIRAQALRDAADRLRKAGASLPAPEVKGTVESAVVTGLSAALAMVEVMADEAEKEANHG